jgi:MOSC domain-containing protein YiiM
MQLRSINVALPTTVEHDGRSFTTGIFKKPVCGPVALRRHNLEGDGQGDRTVHGGEFKAVYAYPFEHYATWARELDRDDLEPGQFGENLTVEGMLEHEVHIGDVFRIGSAVVEVSQPRLPCATLAMKMNSRTFPKQFLASGRLGFYLRVVDEGTLSAGDSIERLHIGDEHLKITDLWRAYHVDKDDLDTARRALRLPTLQSEWRQPFELRLAEAGERT